MKRRFPAAANWKIQQTAMGKRKAEGWRGDAEIEEKLPEIEKEIPGTAGQLAAGKD